MTQQTVNIWFWIYWLGLILMAYGLVTFVTARWSREAMETAGTYGLYTAPLIAVIGVIFLILGHFKK